VGGDLCPVIQHDIGEEAFVTLDQMATAEGRIKLHSAF
jgi:hypothetical protein